MYGNSFKSTLVAVVVPQEEALQDWAKSKGKTGETGDMVWDWDTTLHLLCVGRGVGGGSM